MKNIISQIVKNENISEIFSYAINNIFLYGPTQISDLEILTYISIYNREYFNKNLDKVLNFMGIFYKEKFQSTTLEEVVFGQYRKHIKDVYNEYYTPVQSQILYRIDNSKCYSFSAPTSTGKSYVFLKKIKESLSDVVIVVPSRALINEYLLKLESSLEDKSINILPFIDKINTKRAIRNVFVVTPERCRELFKLKKQFEISLFLFDEAQLSNEESTRGILFDGIVRRCYKSYPGATFVFAHPFVKNPDAQLIKNHFEFTEKNYKQFNQKNVGQIFFYHNKSDSNFYHFGIDKSLMGNLKVNSNFDPIKNVLQDNGSVLFYVSKASIKNNKVFKDFENYINTCLDYPEGVIDEYLNEIIEYTGGTVDKNKDYYSKMVSYLRRGIVIHHGSLPLKIRSILEKYTNNGYCKICFATSTLEQGVNMPFDLVYLNRLDGSKPLSVKNLIGRAGRSTANYKFDYGVVIVKNMSEFRKIMTKDEELANISLLETDEGEKDEEYNDFKAAILHDTFDDELNLTESQVAKLSSDEVFKIIHKLLNVIFENHEIVSLETLNEDVDEKLELYENFETIYSNYLGRDLSHGEKNVFNTAIKIILWKVHGKTFKNICWYRYSYASLSNYRRIIKNRPNLLNNLPARFYTEYAEIPNKNLNAYSALNGVLAKNVDYDFIISDTYDFIDKIIGFKLIDVFNAALTKYFERTDDLRAIKLSKLIKYGTDNERHILMLRYGLTFEDIEILDEHILSISEEEILVKQSIYSLTDSQKNSIKRYL